MQAHKCNSIALAHIGTMFPGELMKKKPWLKSPMRLDLSGLRNYIKFCLQYTLEGRQTDYMHLQACLKLVWWLGWVLQHTRAQNIKFPNYFLSFGIRSLTQSFSGRKNYDIHCIIKSSRLRLNNAIFFLSSYLRETGASTGPDLSRLYVCVWVVPLQQEAELL